MMKSKFLQIASQTSTAVLGISKEASTRVYHRTMSSDAQSGGIVSRSPFYQIVDGFCIPGFFSPKAFKSGLAYKARPDDLIIVTYPKCGTTWTQNIVASIFKFGRPIESAFEFFSQTPFLEMVGAEAVGNMDRPGAIKCHLPFHLTPRSAEAKYIFVARNPKDCCVSYYHHTESIAGYRFAGGSFDDYFELFIDGKVDFGDYFDMTMSWYEHRNDPNVLFLTYEEMKKDIAANVLKIAEFMGPKYKEAVKGEVLKDIIHHSSFAYMKEALKGFMTDLHSLPKELIANNPDIPQGLRALLSGESEIFNKDHSNPVFVRKGIIGDWKNYFSTEQNLRLERKFKEKMGDTELAELWKDIM